MCAADEGEDISPLFMSNLDEHTRAAHFFASMNTHAPHTLVVVPYRPSPPGTPPHRQRQLNEWLHTVGRHLTQRPNMRLALAIHDGPNPFNRGLALQAAVRALRLPTTTAIMTHDVDLRPRSKEVAQLVYDAKGPDAARHPVWALGRAWVYTCRSKQTGAVSRTRQNGSFMGGVMWMHASAWDAIGGFPTACWGWGREDDVVYARCVARRVLPRGEPVFVHPAFVEHPESEREERAQDWWHDMEWAAHERRDGADHSPAKSRPVPTQATAFDAVWDWEWERDVEVRVRASTLCGVSMQIVHLLDGGARGRDGHVQTQGDEGERGGRSSSSPPPPRDTRAHTTLLPRLPHGGRQGGGRGTQRRGK